MLACIFVSKGEGGAITLNSLWIFMRCESLKTVQNVVVLTQVQV